MFESAVVGRAWEDPAERYLCSWGIGGIGAPSSGTGPGQASAGGSSAPGVGGPGPGGAGFGGRGQANPIAAAMMNADLGNIPQTGNPNAPFGEISPQQMRHRLAF